MRDPKTFVRDKRSPHPDEIVPEKVDHSLLPSDTDPKTIDPDRIIERPDLPKVDPRSTKLSGSQEIPEDHLNDTEFVLNVDKELSQPTSTPARGSNDPPPDLSSGPNVDHFESGTIVETPGEKIHKSARFVDMSILFISQDHFIWIFI